MESFPEKMNNDTNSTSQSGMECGFYEGYTLLRFIIIAIFSGCSLFGVLSNTLLILVFIRNISANIYLATLALLDMLLCLTYILLFGVDAAIFYMMDATLFILYYTYILPTLYLAKVVQFAIPYMLILITFERYLWTARERTRECFSAIFSDMGRVVTVVFVAVFSLWMRLPVILASEVTQYPNCSDYFRTESLGATEWYLENEDAYKFFDLHVITFVQTFGPFIILVTLNIVIIQRMVAEKKQHLHSLPSNRAFSEFAIQNNGNMPENCVLLEVATEVIKESLIHSETEMSPTTQRRHSVLLDLSRQIEESSRTKRNQLRNAIYTMVAIVTSYLVCNLFHLFLTLLEKFETSILYTAEDNAQSSDIYIALSDTVSILYMLSSAIRLFIYIACNPKLRNEIVQFITRSSKLQYPPIID